MRDDADHRETAEPDAPRDRTEKDDKDAESPTQDTKADRTADSDSSAGSDD